MKYKYLLLIIFLCFSQVSCTNDDCLLEESRINERYNELISLAGNDLSKITILTEERNNALKNLGCQ
jgi:hypothetical protein